jgi:endonuclease YncB( thermonuclease family)
MRKHLSLAILTLIGIVLAFSAQTQGQTAEKPEWRPIAPDATFLTGDTWTKDQITYRLYGVQACIRGTTFTNEQTSKSDCGNASMLMLVNLVNDWRPMCYPVYQTQDAQTQFVICSARITRGQSAGAVIDLGTALISSGFAFASLNANGQPVDQAYLVSQMVAKNKKKGLWAFADVPDPNFIIMQKLKASVAPSKP